MSSDVCAVNGNRIKGFVKIELYDKYGNLKSRKSKHNLITLPAKNYMLIKSAASMLQINDNVFGQYARQGGDFVRVGYNSNDYGNFGGEDNCLTNVLLNLTADQRAAINSQTRFVNIWNNTMSIADKLIGKASGNLTPAADGKTGIPDFERGLDIVSGNVISRKWKYADGIATGTINAVMMCNASTLKDPSGAAGGYDRGDWNAPGFVLGKCLDRVNTRYANFTSLSKGFIPPGIPGVTAEDEVITDYSVDGVSLHKINLSTGEIVDSTETFPLIAPCLDYYVEGDYVYTLTRSTTYASLTVYQISTKSQVTSVRVDIGGACFARLLYFGNTLYINSVSLGNNKNILFKLEKGTSPYWSKLAEAANTYTGILTIPSGLSEQDVCFGNYKDKYIMYISREKGTKTYSNSVFATGYIFSDITNIAGSLEDCIPSVYAEQLVFKNNTLGGILGIGMSHTSTSTPNESAQYAYKSSTFDGTVKQTDLTKAGLFYTKEGNWSNIVSIVLLDGEDIVEKGATDVLFVTYGYKIV